MNPKFSIIIPAYNAEEHIDKALASIAAQTFTDYELIVVCDRCTDRTEEIVRSYNADAITVNVDFGRDGMSRDKGIELATGDWILFLDDDDWYLHEYCFQLLADVVGKHDEDVLCFSYIWKDRGYTKQTPETFTDVNRQHVWSRCWRREAIGSARFGNATYCSDTYFTRKMYKQIKRVVFYDTPIVYYNFMRQGSQTEKLVHGESYMHPVARIKGGKHE